jgi:hypothetical protein
MREQPRQRARGREFRLSRSGLHAAALVNAGRAATAAIIVRN